MHSSMPGLIFHRKSMCCQRSVPAGINQNIHLRTGLTQEISSPLLPYSDSDLKTLLQYLFTETKYKVTVSLCRILFEIETITLRFTLTMRITLTLKTHPL